jgi:hypothetical protein
VPEVPVERILLLLWNQYGYPVAGCKATYKQFCHQPVLALVQEHKPRIVHLTRANVVRQTASQFVLWAANQEHGKEETPIVVVPAVFLERCELIVKTRSEMRGYLAGFRTPILEVGYEQLTGGEGYQSPQIAVNVARCLCRFLGVAEMPLAGSSKRSIGRPLRATFANWSDLEQAINKSEFAPWLEHETHWVQDGKDWVYRDA